MGKTWREPMESAEIDGLLEGLKYGGRIPGGEGELQAIGWILFDQEQRLRGLEGRAPPVIHGRSDGAPPPLAQARALLQRARRLLRKVIPKADALGGAGREEDELQAEIDAFLAGLPITARANAALPDNTKWNELIAWAAVLGLGELRDAAGLVPEHAARAIVAQGLADAHRRARAGVMLSSMLALLDAEGPR